MKMRYLKLGLAGLVLAGALNSDVYSQELRIVKKPIDYKTSDFSADSDEILLARMIFGEARGCSEIEKIAVGYTAVNRAKDGKKWNGETVREAILKPWQYSCFNENDANRKKLMDPMTNESKSFIECLEIAKGILSGKYRDPTNGATHYFNSGIVKPKWASKLEKIGKIDTGKGNSVHEFYKEN